MILAQMGLLGASPQSNLSSSTDVKALVLTRTFPLANISKML